MIGITQGRLTDTNSRILQKFPKNYPREFENAGSLNYDFIEFFTEKDFNKKNPIWSRSGIYNYKKLAKENKLKIHTFCDNYIIKHSIFKRKNLNYLKKLLKQLKVLKVKKLVLPLYNASNINNNNLNKFYRNLREICKYSLKLNLDILIECNISPKYFGILKENVGIKNLFFLFDTGNRVNLKSNLYDDLMSFGGEIKHIHLKDKNKSNKNVSFNSGQINFVEVFKVLKKIKYKNSFTIESTRGRDALKTAKKNLLYFQNFIKKL